MILSHDFDPLPPSRLEMVKRNNNMFPKANWCPTSGGVSSQREYGNFFGSKYLIDYGPIQRKVWFDGFFVFLGSRIVVKNYRYVPL